MKHLLRTFAVAALALAGLTTAANAQSVPDRLDNQRERIRNGVQNGSLTRNEAYRLRQEQLQIHRQILRNRHDGGGLTAREAARIRANAKQNSRQIARLRHNGRTR